MEPEHAISNLQSEENAQTTFFVEQNSSNTSILARATNVHDSSLGDQRAATKLKHYFEMLLTTSTTDRKCWDET